MTGILIVGFIIYAVVGVGSAAVLYLDHRRIKAAEDAWRRKQRVAARHLAEDIRDWIDR